MAIIELDRSRVLGRIKPMHGVGQPPFLGIDYSYIRYLKEANIPFSRLHDVGGMFGGNLYVDIPNIFRDFSADETDPASYDFTFTDMLITALVKYDCQPVYRLGVTIENYHDLRCYRLDPPSDMEKWARICEHIIRHYNEGWANGFHYQIQYWEIWNEPDNGRDNKENMMWHGTKEQFYELYRVTSKHLRACFGNSIKIGGYAHSGFYVVDAEKVATGVGLGLNEAPSEWDLRTQYFITFFDGFLDMVVKEKLPFDFFSHHSYASVSNTLLRQKYAEKRLAEAGLSHVEIHLNEWNTNASKEERGRSIASAHAAAMMCVMQNQKMDMMCYYDAQIGASIYGGMFHPMSYEPLCTYYSFKAFGALYALGTQIACSCDCDHIYTLAATDGEKTGILITNVGPDSELSLPAAATVKAFLIDEDHFMVPVSLDPQLFQLKENQVLYLETMNPKL